MPENPQHTNSSQTKTDEALVREALAAGVPQAWITDFLARNYEDEHRIGEAYFNVPGTREDVRTPAGQQLMAQRNAPMRRPSSLSSLLGPQSMTSRFGGPPMVTRLSDLLMPPAASVRMPSLSPDFSRMRS